MLPQSLRYSWLRVDCSKSRLRHPPCPRICKRGSKSATIWNHLSKITKTPPHAVKHSFKQSPGNVSPTHATATPNVPKGHPKDSPKSHFLGPQTLFVSQTGQGALFCLQMDPKGVPQEAQRSPYGEARALKRGPQSQNIK